MRLQPPSGVLPVLLVLVGLCVVLVMLNVSVPDLRHIVGELTMMVAFYTVHDKEERR